MSAKQNKKRQQIRETLTKFKFEVTNEKLSMAAGLGSLMELFDKTELKKEFIACLPERTSAKSVGSYQMALTLMAAFLYGYDCLEDLDQFRNDPKLTALFGNATAAARTHGDFLRDFEPEHIQRLNQFLNRMSRYIFDQLKTHLPEEFKPKDLVIDMDSTSHVQHGEKMEGLAYNYKNEWCLDSQVSFNSIGLCHGFQLRPGNTKSGVDAESLIRQSFEDSKTQVERRFKFQDFFRADSAYCNQSIIKTLLDLGIHFTLTAHDGTTGWKKQMEQEGLVWQDWVHSEEEVKKAELRGRALPKIQVSRFYWVPEWSKAQDSKLMFPIVVKRTWQPVTEKQQNTSGYQSSLFHQQGVEHLVPWDYYAVVTNFPLNLPLENLEKSTKLTTPSGTSKSYSIQEVFEFHQVRGNSENFIREEKYGYDLKHFPCLKLQANHAYGLLAMVAHNILRWVALMTKPEKPHFSKKLRQHFIFIPAKIVYHARVYRIKMMQRHHEGVKWLRERLRLNSEIIPPQFSSA